jgi:hypothetical protein
MRLALLLTLVASFCFAGRAHADGRFHKAPKSKLQIRVVQYDGDVNGALTVEIKNPTKKPLKFTAEGLYFVPDGDPDAAPQRLGAVGPMQIAHDDEKVDEVDAITVGASDTVRVTLDVFCIDEQRSAPTSETPFSVGKKRMPAKLARAIATGTRELAGDDGAKPAKGDIQDKVWETRNKKWVKLDGEGAQEQHR